MAYRALDPVPALPKKLVAKLPKGLLDELYAQFENGDFEYLIIDELGKLELKNQGLHRSAKHIFGSDVEGKNIVLVVRSFMVEQIIAHYNIRNYKVVSIEELP